MSHQFNLGIAGRISDDYGPEAEARINLYARLARARGEEELDALSDEMEDRFGPSPEQVRQLFVLTRMRLLCREAGIARVDAEPQAIALTFRADLRKDAAIQRLTGHRRGGSYGAASVSSTPRNEEC